MDVFICHTSTDKDEVVRPLADMLRRDSDCWVDENEILWGDSVTEKVNEGIRASRYVIVVFSKTFLKRNWPQRELNAALNIEATTGIPKVLPLLAGSESDRREIIDAYPLLNDKLSMRWPEDRDALLEQVSKLLKRAAKIIDTGNSPQEPENTETTQDVYIPNIHNAPTDKEIQDYARAGYTTISSYFERGLKQLSTSRLAIESEFEGVHSRKFVAQIYFRGKEVSKCKIWLSSSGGFGQITYSNDFHSVDEDSGYNEMLSVGPESLRWTALGSSYVAERSEDGMSHDEASRYLWRLFVHTLES